MFEYIIKQLQEANPLKTLIIVLGLAAIWVWTCIGGLLLTSCAFHHPKNDVYVTYKYDKWVSGVERVKYTNDR